MTKHALFYCMNAAGKPEEISGASAIPVNFSALRALEPMDDTAQAFLILVSQALCATAGPIAVYGSHGSIRALLELSPELRERIRCRLVDYEGQTDPFSMDVPACLPAALPPEIRTIYFNVPGFQRARGMRKRLREGLEIVSPEQVAAQFPDCVPMRAWVQQPESIYPLDIPDITLPTRLDFLLLDLPAKNMGFMPNGLAYVHNALRKTGLKCATFDLDIVVYHRFHTHRLLDAPWRLATPAGELVPEDPWRAEHSNLWGKGDFLDCFSEELEAFYVALRKAAPKVVGFSVHEANALCVERIANRLKRDLPEVIIVAGGYSCLDPTFARAALPIADYTVVGEADLTIGPLAERLVQGELPGDLPGVISRFDTPGHAFEPAVPPQDLDALELPDYEWFGPSLYRNYDGYQLIPITMSRGCRWSRCTFCTERFPWRTRSAKSVADELESHYRQGGDLFLFNDSDFNADREVMLGLCAEIERRQLLLRLTGQLRIDRHNTLEYFKAFKKAGFVSLHFGVDAWSKRSLITAYKGYAVPVILENLKACHEAGVYCEINLIVAYPGETDEDIEETIGNILEAKPYIGRIAVINPLMMKTGSLFWEHSETYCIRFHGDKQELARQYPTGVPSHLWHSEEPLLDEAARNARVLRVVKALEQNGVPMSGVATARLKEMAAGQDALRGSLRSAPIKEAARPDEAAKSAQYADYGLIGGDGSRYVLDQASLAAVCGWLGISRDAHRLTKALREGKARMCETFDPSAILLVSSGVPGYNLIQVGRQYAAIRHGVAFNPLMFALDSYASGDCVQGRSVKQVVETLQKR